MSLEINAESKIERSPDVQILFDQLDFHRKNIKSLEPLISEHKEFLVIVISEVMPDEILFCDWCEAMHNWRTPCLCPSCLFPTYEKFYECDSCHCFAHVACGAVISGRFCCFHCENN